MTVTVLTLLRRAPSLDADAFIRRWEGPHAELVLRLPGLRRYVQALPHPDARNPQAYDGVAMVDLDDLDALRAANRSEAFRAIRADEEDLVDRSALVSFVIERKPVVPATRATGAQVLFLGFMHRAAGLGRDEFRAHWRDRHAALAARLPGLRSYVHCVPVHLGGDPPFDGAAELRFDSVTALREAFRSEAGLQVRSDEARFINPSGSFALQLRERRLL